MYLHWFGIVYFGLSSTCKHGFAACQDPAAKSTGLTKGGLIAGPKKCVNRRVARAGPIGGST